MVLLAALARDDMRTVVAANWVAALNEMEVIRRNENDLLIVALLRPQPKIVSN